MSPNTTQIEAKKGLSAGKMGQKSDLWYDFLTSAERKILSVSPVRNGSQTPELRLKFPESGVKPLCARSRIAAVSLFRKHRLTAAIRAHYR
jgi:hypothetical protein